MLSDSLVLGDSISEVCFGIGFPFPLQMGECWECGSMLLFRKVSYIQTSPSLLRGQH